jgi:hypothetical protein
MTLWKYNPQAIPGSRGDRHFRPATGADLRAVPASVFETVALSQGDLTIGLALSSLIFWAVELEKWAKLRTAAARAAALASLRS